MNTLDLNIGAQVPPKFLRPDFERMPRELTPLKNWVLWVPIWNGSKWTKRPIQPSGFGASTTNPKHWSSFETVKQAYERAAERGYIELRKNVDIAGRPGIDHLFLVDGKGTRYVDCTDVPLTYGPALVRDVLHRTETAMPQAHCFLACELALAAQARANHLTAPA